MTNQSSEPLNQPIEDSPARRRRARRMLTQLRADEREAFLEDLAHIVGGKEESASEYERGHGDDLASLHDSTPVRSETIAI